MSKPKNIILIRHGESSGNIDKSIYSSIPDYALRLTENGRLQALDCANNLFKMIGDNSIAVYYSPFFRSRETMEIVTRGLKLMFSREDSRLREQEWSGGLREDGYSEELEKERDAFGHFYFRFNGGESCADVEDRMSSFLDTLHRDFKKSDFPEYCLIFSHGMTNRLFIKRWFHKTVEEFEKWANPKNCEFWIMERNNLDKYDLKNIIREHKLKHRFQYD